MTEKEKLDKALDLLATAGLQFHALMYGLRSTGDAKRAGICKEMSDKINAFLGEVKDE